jgi:hypothetical protein
MPEPSMAANAVISATNHAAFSNCAVMQERLGLYRVVILLFVALAIGVLASLVVVALGRPYALSPRGEWNGIFHHKNLPGVSSVLLIYAGLALVKKYWLVVLPVLALAMMALIGAYSATSLLALCAVVGVILVALILPLRFYSFAVAGSFMLAAVTPGGRFRARQRHEPWRRSVRGSGTR